MTPNDNLCLKDLDKKVDDLVVDVAFIKGKLEGKGTSLLVLTEPLRMATFFFGLSFLTAVFFFALDQSNVNFTATDLGVTATQTKAGTQ